MSRAPTVGLILCAAVALAGEPRPELAPYPLEIVRTSADCTKKDREDLQMLLPMMLRAAEASVPDAAGLSAALADLPRQDCDRNDACLAQLGKLTGSLYAFYAQLDFDLDGDVVATGRVVRDDGKAVRGPETVKVARVSAASCRGAAQAALRELLTTLDVAHLPPLRPQEQVVEANPLPLPEPAPRPMPEPAPMPMPVLVPRPVTASRTGNPLRIAALAGAGTGAACMAIGGVLFATAGGARTDLSQGVVRVFSEDANKVAAIQRAQTAGVVLLAVGAGVAAAGAGLYFFGPGQPMTSVVPINGGAAVLIRGTLR